MHHLKFVLFASPNSSQAEGILFSDGKAVINKKGKLESFPSIDAVIAEHPEERGFKVVVEPRSGR